MPPLAPSDPSVNAACAPVLVDEFPGTSINAGKWTVYDRDSDLVNGEVNAVRPANATVAGGVLSILAEYLPGGITAHDSIAGDRTVYYASAQLAQATAPFLYGTVEVRAKAPGGIGLWPCIWMLGFEWQASQPYTANTPEHNGPHAGWCEIDIAEFMGNERSEVNCQIHFETNNVGPGICALPYDATTRYMVYRLQWRAGSAIFSVDAEDGVGWRTLGSTTGANVPNVPMYVIVNCAIGGSAVGAPNPATFPQTMLVDYVRVTR